MSASENDPAARVDGLTHTLRRGAVLSAGSLLAVQLVSFVQTLVIARILSPAEVGVFAAGTVLAAFLVTFSEGGLRNALVQREHDLEDAADTVFWATFGFGVLWSAAAAACSPLVALVFHSSTAGWVAVATAGSIILHSLTNVPDALLQRRFDFRQRVVVQPSVAISFAVASVTSCALGFGVWGLVIGSYVSQLVWLATTWWLAAWRPGRGKASFRMWRELADFGLPLVLGTVVDRARDLLETTIVGGALNQTALGHYRYGRRLAALPGTAIIEVGSYVLFPAFSRMADDRARMRSAFLRALEALWCVAAPVAGLVVAVGQPVVVLMLGEPWRGAGVMFAALAGSGPGVAMCAIGMESIKGCGRTRLLNWITGYSSVVGIALLLALLPFGLWGLGLALSITSFTAGVLSLLLARTLVDVSVHDLLKRLLPGCAAAVVATAALAVTERAVVHADRHGIALGLALVGAEVVGFAVVYLAVLRCLAPGTVREISAAARSLRRSTRAPAP